MRAFVYDAGEAREAPFEEGVSARGQAELVWLHLDARIPAARACIETATNIPPIARSALIASETRPRSDLMGQGALINLRALGKTPEDDPDALVSVRIWVEAGLVVSVTLRSPEPLDRVVQQFLSGSIKDPGDLLSAGADAITDTLDPEVAELGDELDTCEIDLDGKSIWEMRRKVTRVRSLAIGYRRFVGPQRQALERLASAPVAWLDEDDRLHLREAADRAARMAEELESVRERAALMHDELTDLRGEQMDSRALLISIVALVFLPLTFITGLLGMNVEGIPFAREPEAFWGVTGICTIVAIGLFGWFLRNHWLGRG